jgi:hypothetical protein
MLQKIFLLLGVVCAIVLVGCSKSETPGNGPSATTANVNKAAASSTPTAATANTAGEKIGVPECDAFIANYDACISGKVPEAARAQYKTAIEQWRTSWHQLAANPSTKGTLAAACKQSAEQARLAMKSYNCTF